MHGRRKSRLTEHAACEKDTCVSYTFYIGPWFCKKNKSSTRHGWFYNSYFMIICGNLWRFLWARPCFTEQSLVISICAIIITQYLWCGWRVIISVTSYERHGDSNHREHNCLFNSLLRLTSKKISRRGGNIWQVVPITNGQLRGKLSMSLCNIYICVHTAA